MMTKAYLTIGFFLFSILIGCDKAPRDINTEHYVGRVYEEMPNHKDVPIVPYNNEIDEFEKILSSRLNSLIKESTDETVKRNGPKILKDLKLYKRRYFGVMTIENERKLMVEFLHPDGLLGQDQWKEATLRPQLDNYTYFEV